MAESYLPYNQLNNEKSSASTNTRGRKSSNDESFSQQKRFNSSNQSNENSSIPCNGANRHVSKSHPLLHNSGRGAPFRSSLCMQTALSDCSGNNRKTFTQGKPIPDVIIKIIHFLLGIKENENKRSITGTVFYGITIAVAVGEFY